MRRLYSLPAAADVPHSANRQGVAAFNNESFRPADLAAFQKRNGLPAAPAETLGPAVQPKGTGEGELDVQWLMGMAPTVPAVVWATFGYVGGGQNIQDKTSGLGPLSAVGVLLIGSAPCFALCSQRYNPADKKFDNEVCFSKLL